MGFLIKVATVVIVATALVSPATTEANASPAVITIATVSGAAGSLATS
jgi:hypothetical protein